jgi:hypothetical protein
MNYPAGANRELEQPYAGGAAPGREEQHNTIRLALLLVWQFRSEPGEGGVLSCFVRWLFRAC